MARVDPQAIYAGIEQAVAKYSLPPEARRALHAIAKIESGYGRNNVGRAIGTEVSGDRTHQGQRAMGPFQFMPKTAKAYGLRDPMDPIASADAAARHMIDSYKRQGDWFKAAVGHHSGPAWKSLGKHGRDYVTKLQRELESGIGVDDAYMARVMGGRGVDRRMASNAGPNDGSPPADWTTDDEDDALAFAESLGLSMVARTKARPPQPAAEDDDAVAFAESMGLPMLAKSRAAREAKEAAEAQTPAPSEPQQTAPAVPETPPESAPEPTMGQRIFGDGDPIEKILNPLAAIGGGFAGIAKGGVDVLQSGAKVADAFMEPFGLGLGPVADSPVVSDFLGGVKATGEQAQADGGMLSKGASFVPRAMMGSTKVLKDAALQGGLTFLERDDLPINERVGQAGKDAVMAGGIGAAFKGVRSALFGPNHLPTQAPGGATTPMQNAEAIGAVPPVVTLRQDPHEIAVAHRGMQQGLLGGATFRKQLDQAVTAVADHALIKGFGVKLPAGAKLTPETDWSAPLKNRIRDLRRQQAALPPDQQWSLDEPIRDLKRIRKSLTPNGRIEPRKLQTALMNTKSGVPEATQAAKVLEDIADPQMRFAAGNEVGVMMPKRALRSMVGLLDNHSTLPEAQLFRGLQAMGIPRRGLLTSIPGSVGQVFDRYGNTGADALHGATRSYGVTTPADERGILD